MKKSVKQNYQQLLNSYYQTTHSFNSSKMSCNNDWFKNKDSFSFWINTLKQDRLPLENSTWYSCFDSAIAKYPLETITVNHLNQFLLAPLKQHPHLKKLKFKKIIDIDQAQRLLFVVADIYYCKTSFKFSAKNSRLWIPVV